MKENAIMNKKIIPAMVLVVLGLVIAIGSQTFLGPCVHEDGSFGACHWAGQALLGVSLLLTAEALLSAILERARFGLCLASALTSALGFLMPGGLIDICKMDTMRCRMVMQPAMRVLFGLALIVSVAGLLKNKGKRGAA